MKVYNISDQVCELGEGPFWDHIHGELWWVDILRGTIHQYAPDSGLQHIFQIGQLVSSVVLRENGGCIVTLKDGFAYFHPETELLEPIVQPETELLSNRFNDGKCDPEGRFWAGTMHLDGEKTTGSVYMLDTKHNLSIHIRHVICANGLAWDTERSKFYFVDTLSRKITAYDYDAATGKISNENIIITIPSHEGLPDGMTIDREGMLWIALWGGWCIARYNPLTGECLDRIQLPVSNVTSCTFGGANMGDIYITTAKTGLTSKELQEQPLAGSVFVCTNTGHSGWPSVYFKG